MACDDRPAKANGEGTLDNRRDSGAGGDRGCGLAGELPGQNHGLTIQAPGRKGSLSHLRWCDPRGWFGGGAPTAIRSRQVAYYRTLSRATSGAASCATRRLLTAAPDR
jgi:hypothetical protein